MDHRYWVCKDCNRTCYVVGDKPGAYETKARVVKEDPPELKPMLWTIHLTDFCAIPPDAQLGSRSH